jgi:hypothetical protein
MKLHIMFWHSQLRLFGVYGIFLHSKFTAAVVPSKGEWKWGGGQVVISVHAGQGEVQGAVSVVE